MKKYMLIALMITLCSLYGCGAKSIINTKLEDVYIDTDQDNTGVMFDNGRGVQYTDDFVKIYVFNDDLLSDSNIQYDKETDTYITKLKRLFIIRLGYSV